MLSPIRLSDNFFHEYSRAGSKEEGKGQHKMLDRHRKNERSEVYIDFKDKYNYKLLAMVLDNVIL